MKKEDIDPEVFKLLSDSKQSALNEGENVEAVYLLASYDPIFGKKLTPRQKEHLIKFIISEFPQDCSEQDFAEWRHTVQVNNGFEYNLKKHNSENHLLNDENIEYGLKLADFIAQKTLEIGDWRSADSIKRIINGFMMYNWNQLRKNGFDAPIVIPETFRKPEFFDLVYGEGKDINKTEIQSLFQSKTIRDWIKKCVKMSPDKKGMMTPFSLSEWGKIFEKYPWPEGQKYVLPSDCDESVQRIEAYKKMSKKNPKGKADGIFVDIDGTLFDHEGHFDIDLYKLLVEISKHEKVTIFTGGNVEKQTQRLRKLLTEYANNGKIAKGDVNKFQIVSKEDYRGFLFTGFIIDDISPERQGFLLEDSKNRYLNIKYLYNLDWQKEIEKIKEKEDIEDALEGLCLATQIQEKNERAEMAELYDVRRESMDIGERIDRDEYGLGIAVKAHRLRYPSLSQRLKGAQSDRKAALEVIKKYHEAHPKQKTALKFKPSKKSERE